MALQAIPGQGLWLPFHPDWSDAGASMLAQSQNINTSTAKVAFMGRVWAKERFSGNKNINNIEFLAGSGTTPGTGTTTARISIQGVSTSASPPRPDGTIAGTGNGAFTTLTVSSLTSGQQWISGLSAFSAVAQVSMGSFISVVFELTTVGTSPVLSIAGAPSASTQHGLQTVTTTDGTTWSIPSTNSLANIVLKFDDGTVGTLAGAFVFSALTSTSYNSGNSPNESGLVFQVPFACKIDALWSVVAANNAASSGSLELTDGTGTLIGSASASYVGGETTGTNTGRVIILPIPETTLSINTDYYLGNKATNASNTVSQYYFDVPSSAYLGLNEVGANFRYSTRSGGSWAAATTTRRPLMGLRVSALDDGTGGAAGGLLGHPGMGGRLLG